MRGKENGHDLYEPLFTDSLRPTLTPRSDQPVYGRTRTRVFGHGTATKKAPQKRGLFYLEVAAIT